MIIVNRTGRSNEDLLKIARHRESTSEKSFFFIFLLFIFVVGFIADLRGSYNPAFYTAGSLQFLRLGFSSYLTVARTVIFRQHRL